MEEDIILLSRAMVYTETLLGLFFLKINISLDIVSNTTINHRHKSSHYMSY